MSSFMLRALSISNIRIYYHNALANRCRSKYYDINLFKHTLEIHRTELLDH